jgi:hypothetical protein
MSTLVLHLESADGNRLLVTPSLRQVGRPDQIGPTACCDAKQVQTLSRDMYRMLAEAIKVGFNDRGDLSLAAARGHLERLRALGTQLREQLLTEPTVRQLEANASLQHVLLECTPQWNTLPLELMFLHDFLCFRCGIGRQLHTTSRTVPSPRQQSDRGFQAFSVVDPGRLLADAGTDLRPGFQAFRDRWESLVHDNGSSFRQLIDFDAARVFRSTSPQQMADAVRHHSLVTFVGHHHFDPQNPEHSGFVLGRGDGDREIVFTAEDLQECLGAGQAPPLVLLSIACRSGLTEGWQMQWIDDDRVFGMVDAAIRSGIPHYIGTVVKVPAQRSSDVMLPLYEQLARGQTIGRALCQARRALRAVTDDPLDGGTLLGLSLVLYGDPSTGYFCAGGHRCEAAATVTCQVVTDTGVCGRIVCDRDPDFAQGRCSLHAAAPVRCSAGHPVADHSQLAACRMDGCHNTVCPACRGWGQGLCWEHCCYDQGHPIVTQAEQLSRKTCLDPLKKHPDEPRSVGLRDAGWLRGLCSECLAAANQPPPACPHCGRWIDEQKNPLSGTCQNCQQPLCAACRPWYEATLYCRIADLAVSDRDAKWLELLEQRAAEEQDGGQDLAAPARLRAKLAASNAFLDGLATNVVEQTRRLDLLPRLRLSAADVLLPWPRALGGVRQNATEQDTALKVRFRDRWGPRVDPPWEPPTTWQDAYQTVNRLQVHEVRGLAGSPVLVAVATVTPVMFQANRGPVLIPADADHLARIEQTLRQGWADPRKTELPDVYLVVFSTTGWAEVAASYRPGLWTSLAEPDGDQVRVWNPPLDGRPRHIREFVSRLVPTSVYRQKQAIREWIEAALETEEFATHVKVQDGIAATGDLSYDGRLVKEVCDEMVESGRYRHDQVNGQRAIRPATRQERGARLARRWWWEIALSVLLVLVSLFPRLLPMFERPSRPVAIGAIAMILACYLAGHVFKNFIQFLRQT